MLDAENRSPLSSDRPISILLSGGVALPAKFIQFWSSSTLCDARIRVESRTFEAHRMVLAATSDYFEALIVNERFADSSGTFELPEMDADAFAAVLAFMYHGKCEVTNARLLVEVLQAAMRLQVVPLAAAAATAMKRRLAPNTALVIWQHAEQNNLGGLADAAILAAARGFEEVAASDEWLRAPVGLVLKLLGAERLSVSSESRVFEAAARWLSGQTPSEETPADELAAAVFGCVRFPLLAREYVLERVLSEPMLQNGAAMRLVAAAGWASSDTSPPVAPRLTFDLALYAVGGLDRFTQCMRSVHRCNDLADGSWEPAPPMAVARSHPGVAILDAVDSATLYVLGGYDGTDALDSAERFDVSRGEWEQVAAMGTGRYACGAVVVDGMLYAVGGRSGDEVLSSVERFDPVSGTWEAVASMKSAREGLGVAALHGAIYVAGGFDGSAPMNSVERLDVSRLDGGEWELMPPIGANRMGCGVAALDGALYVVGGYSDSDSHDGRGPRLCSLNIVERYDEARGVWEALAPMTTSRIGCGLAAADGALYAVGGRSSGQVLDSVERYDVSAGTWQSLPSMGLVRSACGVAISH